MAKQSWKGTPKGRTPSLKHAPSKAVVKAPAAPASTFKPSGDTRRDSLIQQIEAAQNALNRESASGFGARSKNAAEHLDKLNKQLADYDSSGFGPQAVEVAKTAVPAVIGGVGGVKLATAIGKTQTAKAATNLQRFNTLAKQVERIRTNTPKNIVGSKAGDKMIALVNEGNVLGGKSAPFTAAGAPRRFQSTRPLFSKAGGKFGFGLLFGIAAEGIASRYVLPNYTTDKTLKEGLQITGTASMAAAVTYAVKRKIDIAKATSLRPASTEIAKVTAAQGQLLREVRAGAPTPRAAALGAAKKVLLPAAMVTAGMLAYAGASRAGESRGRALVKGIKASADVATSGGVSEFEISRAEGVSRAGSGVRAVITAATMGVVPAAERYFSARGTSVSGFIASTVTRALGGRGASEVRRAVVRNAASRGRPLARRGAAPVTISNGRVEGYYRQQGGKSVFVHGYQR